VVKQRVCVFEISADCIVVEIYVYT